MFEEEEGDGCVPVPALIIYGAVGNSTMPSDGLVGFKLVLVGLSQAFEQIQVMYLLPCLYSMLVLTTCTPIHVGHAGAWNGWPCCVVPWCKC